MGKFLEEEFGSGAGPQSRDLDSRDLPMIPGSGWMEDDDVTGGGAYFDDEDLRSRPIEVDVECKLPNDDSYLKKDRVR